MPDISFQCPSCSGSLNVPAEMANQLMECPSCKQTIEVPVRSRPQTIEVPVRSHPQTRDSGSSAVGASGDESVFFQNGDILVTNARFVIGDTTFAIRGITSVETVKGDQDMERSGVVWTVGRGIAAVAFVAMIGLGLFLWLGDDFSFWVVVGLGVVGFGIWHVVYLASIQTKPVFRILLKTAGGDVTAYRGFDREHISQIVRALNDSIISHG